MGGVPPCSGWRCRQTLHYSFPSWSDLVCPLPKQASHSSLPILPPRLGGDAPGADLTASLTDVLLFTSLASDATRGADRVTFRNASQAKTAGANVRHRVPVHHPEYIPGHSKTCTNLKLRCSLHVSPHQYIRASSGALRASVTKGKKAHCRSSLSNLTSEMLLDLELHLASELSRPSEARHFLTTNPSLGPRPQYTVATQITSLLKTYDPID